MRFVGVSGAVYEVTQPRGRGGGQADVFKGVAPDGQVVAIRQARRPRPEARWLDEERERLEELHRANPGLRDYVIAPLDHGVTEETRGGVVLETPFVVLPWFEHDLESWASLGPRPLVERLGVAAQACAAVLQLHRTRAPSRAGVVHRDIKPQNFLLDPREGGPRVVLADFGSARNNLATASTAASHITQLYAPPDQAVTRKGVNEQRWDVFALAATVYRLVVGKLPDGVYEVTAAPTTEGNRLAELRRREGSRLTRAERAELAQLQELPLDALVRIPRGSALLSSDQERLRTLLCAHVSLSPEEGLPEPFVALLAALADALHRHPDDRCSDVQPLLSACRRALELAGRPSPLSFGWLQLSGLLVGRPDHATRWPGVEERLFDDLEALHSRCGPWDLLIIAGDLSWSGAPDELARAEGLLVELREHLRRLGSDPRLVIVPGVHDVERPDPRRPEVRVLARWGADPSVREELWSDPSSPYRRVVTEGLDPWSFLVARAPLPLPEQRRAGILPGDQAATLKRSAEGREARLGVVALNCAALRLQEGAPADGLALDARQLHACLGSPAHRWAREHDLTLLVCGARREALSPAARVALDAEIAPPGRFSVHLYGGDGPGALRSQALGAAEPRLELETPALLGSLADPCDPASPAGYCVGRATLDGSGARLRFWPRSAARRQAGDWAFGPDTRINLGTDEGTPSFRIQARKATAERAAPVPPPAPIPAPALAPLEEEIEVTEEIGPPLSDLEIEGVDDESGLDRETLERLAAIREARTDAEAWRLALLLALQLVPSEAGSAIQREPSGGARFLETVGPVAQLFRGVRLPKGNGIPDFCMSRLASIIVQDPQNDPRFYRALDKSTGFVTRAVLCVPVTQEGETFGCLELTNPPPGARFERTHIEHVEMVASVLADRLLLGLPAR